MFQTTNQWFNSISTAKTSWHLGVFSVSHTIQFDGSLRSICSTSQPCFFRHKEKPLRPLLTITMCWISEKETQQEIGAFVPWANMWQNQFSISSDEDGEEKHVTQTKHKTNILTLQMLKQSFWYSVYICSSTQAILSPSQTNNKFSQFSHIYYKLESSFQSRWRVKHFRTKQPTSDPIWPDPPGHAFECSRNTYPAGHVKA